ncbi:hypothetical protein D1AOALGA4SA_6791 [Olavius algarvensis Delta 1 endosymbiont]|nr:hypothetical protein D1AOALGA4SA_6791 [Olavius algarvensis Delta 1 endosymbiont]
MKDFLNIQNLEECVMGVLPVLQQGRDLTLCLSNDDLPDFYMEDYSVLGLLVANLDQAHRVLVEKDFSVHKNADYLKVKFDRAEQMPEIVNLLSLNGIDCSMADIVDQIYQG